MSLFSSSCQVAIIGGGAAGTLVALRLLQAAQTPMRLVVLEPTDALGHGVAYATDRPEHVLNVPAARMSLWPEQPEDFIDYLQATGSALTRAQLAHHFAPRRAFVRYLQQRLAQVQARSPATLDHMRLRARSIERDGAGQLQLTLEDGRCLQAEDVVLACGNALRPLPVRGASMLAPAARVDAWDLPALARIPPASPVAIVGTGLSMADSVLSLHAQGHTGPIHLLSRHGLLPLPHDPAHRKSALLDTAALLGENLRARMRRVRAAAREATRRQLPWQAVMDEVRPHVQALWRSLQAADQRRFLRHVVRYWDIHRHRIAPHIHELLQTLQASGQLRVRAARLELAVPQGRCLRLSAHDAHGHPFALDVEYVINATGVELRVQAMRNPLLEQLQGCGVAGAGAHGIGLDCEIDGRLRDVEGRAQDDIHVIGSLRIGSLWESLAIPELRQQALAITQALSARPAHTPAAA
ncbi:MAG: FAD/NAD(P)-binding protein [Pseudoxanthomonas sp.]